MRWTEGGAKACNAAAFVFAGSFPPLQGITYVAWPRGRSREGCNFYPRAKHAPAEHSRPSEPPPLRETR